MIVAPEVAGRRLEVVTSLVGLYVAGWSLVRLPYHWDNATLAPARWDGVGPLTLLGSPPPVWLARFVAVGVIAAGAALALRVRPRVSGPLAALAFLWVGALDSSWGHLSHAENLVALHLVVLAVALLAGRRAEPDLVLTVLAAVTATTYALAGLAKLRYGGWDWVTGQALREQVAFDDLRKALLGAPYSPIAGWAVNHPLLFRPAALVSVAVEIGAPVALLGGRWATRWAAAAWAFHVGILALMAIAFPYPLVGIAFAPLLPVERLARRPRRSPAALVGAPI